jgi:hypothetical protein
MSERAQQDQSRSEQSDNTISLDPDGMAQIQRGFGPRPSFFGDLTLNGRTNGFFQAASTAANFSGQLSRIRSGKTVRKKTSPNTEEDYGLSDEIMEDIVKLAKYIASYGNVSQSSAEDFLIILCLIEDIEDLKLISEVIDLPDLNNPDLLLKPGEILAVQNLYKIAFLASAVEAILKKFARFLKTASNIVDNQEESDDNTFSNLAGMLSGLVGSLTGGLSGSGGGSVRLQNADASSLIGHFLSELTEGARIPMNVIARNPTLMPPSWIGQTMLGESSTALNHTDINSLLPRRIAAFPRATNGSASQSFSMANASSMSGSFNLSGIISALNFPSGANSSGQQARLSQMIDTVRNITGASETETFQVNRADTAIPLQIALSACHSGTEQSPYSSRVFEDGWQLSNAVRNHMQNTDPERLRVETSLS